MKNLDDPNHPPSDGCLDITRRDVLITAGVLAMSTAMDGVAAMQTDSVASSGAASVPLQFRANGKSVNVNVEARTSLLDLLREQLGLTGAKKGCDHGQCGACTVHIDGRRVASCLTLAVQVSNKEITTIEGLASEGGALHPMQQAFIDSDALQCGYCTPGQIMAAVACVHEGHANSPEQIREYMSGNLCRCGAYPGIVAAIQAAAAKMTRS